MSPDGNLRHKVLNRASALRTFKTVLGMVDSIDKTPEWDFILEEFNGAVHFLTDYFKKLENAEIESIAENIPEDLAWVKKEYKNALDIKMRYAI